MPDDLESGAPKGDDGGGRFTRRQLEWVLHRAVEIDAGGQADEFSEADVFAIGDELGVSARSIRRAIADFATIPDEHSDRGPAAVASGTVPGSTQAVAWRVEVGLRQRSMDRCRLYGASCWHQRRDWWPDVKRFGFAPAVHVDIRPDPAGSFLRLRVPVGLLRWLYVVGTAVGMAVAASTTHVGAGSWAAAGVALAAALAGAIAYRRRIDDIRRRLSLFVDEMIEPRAHPTGFDTAGQTRPEMLAADESA